MSAEVQTTGPGLGDRIEAAAAVWAGQGRAFRYFFIGDLLERVLGPDEAQTP
jgi:hypothetical protein